MTIDYFEITWAVSGVLIFTMITWYNYQILRSLQENDELALAKLFVHPQAPSAFRAFAAGMVLYGTAMLIGAVTVNINDLIYHYSSKIGSFVLFLTWIYMVKTLADITHQKSSQDTAHDDATTDTSTDNTINAAGDTEQDTDNTGEQDDDTTDT